MTHHPMLPTTLWVVGLLAMPSVIWAQATPGEDPVVLGARVTYQAFPTAAPAKSGSLDPAADLPAWLRAKVSRFEAQAYTDNPGGASTDSDIVTMTRSEGTRRTCVQEVGSSTTMMRPGSGSQVTPATTNNQIVVLRGDMVNVCR